MCRPPTDFRGEVLVYLPVQHGVSRCFGAVPVHDGPDAPEGVTVHGRSGVAALAGLFSFPLLIPASPSAQAPTARRLQIRGSMRPERPGIHRGAFQTHFSLSH